MQIQVVCISLVHSFCVSRYKTLARADSGVFVFPYLCETLIGSNRVDLDVLALLDEPQVGIVGLVVVHVERLQNKRHASPFRLQKCQLSDIKS